MLIEMSSTVEPTTGGPAPTAHGAEIAAHEGRTARIDRALSAIDELARRRRTHELVQAIERLGAGLGTTMGALDDAIDAVVDAGIDPVAWQPISTPLVPITAFVAAPPAPASVAMVPAVPVAPAAPAAPAAPVVPASAPTVVAPAQPVVELPEAPVEPRRQAPAGLAAFVIDAPAVGA